LRESTEVVVRASIAQTWLAMILMMMKGREDDLAVAGIDLDIVVSLVENYSFNIM
jgi:hypothetical protein